MKSILSSFFDSKKKHSSSIREAPRLHGFSRSINSKQKNATDAPFYILNGPNLNLLGQRDPEIYGSHSLAMIEDKCRKRLQSLKRDLVFRQTNHEGVLIDWVQEAKDQASILLINGGGLTHTSISLLDALLTLTIPVIEVHLSQPLQRESFRHQSYISPAAHGIVAGFGINSYILAIEAALNVLASREEN